MRRREHSCGGASIHTAARAFSPRDAASSASFATGEPNPLVELFSRCTDKVQQLHDDGAEAHIAGNSEYVQQSRSHYATSE